MSNIEQDVQKLKQLMGNEGADADKIIKLICQKTKKERETIKNKYKEEFNSELTKDLLSELKEVQEETIEALFDDPIEYDAKELKKAMKNIGTDEATLIEIICSRSSEQLQEIKEKYKNLFTLELHTEIMNETSSDFQNYLLSLLEGGRSTNKNPDISQCEEWAKKLYEGGENKIGTNEKVFIEFLSKRSIREIIVTFRIYNRDYKTSLLDVIKSEFSSDILNALISTIGAIINPSEYFANKINAKLKEADKLLRLLLTREEIDMPLVREYYKFKFNVEMIEDIKNNTTGITQLILEELAQKDFPQKN